MGVMTETQTSIISPNASPPANPIHANQTPGSHGGADSRCRTDHEVENSAITPVVARGCLTRPLDWCGTLGYETAAEGSQHSPCE